MHFTRTLDTVQAQVTDDDAGKWDARVPCHQIALHKGRLLVPHAFAPDDATAFHGSDDATAFHGSDDDCRAEGLSLSPWATSQVCQKLGIPAGYIKRCPPELVDANLNYWIRSERIGRLLRQDDLSAPPDSLWLLRAKGTTVRGVLSPRYSKLDNAQLLAALRPLVSGTGYQVSLVQLSPESFHLRLVDPRIARDVVPGDRLLVGIHIANSEVGLRAVTVDALVFRVLCENGLIRRLNHKSLLRQRHLHVADARFETLLADALREAVTVAAGFIEQMALAVRAPVPDPEQAIETLGQMWDLPQATTELIRFLLLGEGRQDTLYGLVNAVTAAAQRLPIDERFDLETRAGVLIDTTSTRQADAALRQRLLTGSK